MKKLITLAFVITALLLGAIAIQAQPYSKGKYKKKNNKASKHSNYGNGYGNANYYPTGYRNGHYNYRGVYIYYKTKKVWKYGRTFRNTYKIKVFRNGRKKVKLIKSVPIHRHYGKKVYYRTSIVKRGWKKYKVTYKITRYRNGRIKKQVVKKVRIYNNYNW